VARSPQRRTLNGDHDQQFTFHFHDMDQKSPNMIRFNTACAFAAALILTGALTGCAAYRKCGFDGCRGDAKITVEVSTLLYRHPELQGANAVFVQTLDGEVYLNGLVDTPLQRQTAESIALQAPGVAQVVNMIAINNTR
jgi:osmotically-inducible protein OsmY